MLTISHRLQAKAREKLGVGNWLANERAIQQSTAWQVAKLKADWLTPEKTDHPIVDLCCGIGGDSIWFGKRRQLVAVDVDPMMAKMCAENLRSAVATSAAVVCCSVESFQVPGHAVVHIDPDRRIGNTRASQTPNYQPNWDFAMKLAMQQPAALIKIAPAASVEQSDAFHRIWLSLKGSVREQTLVCGRAMDWVSDVLDRQLSNQNHSAVIIDGKGNHNSFSDTPNQTCNIVSLPMDYMIAPDAAVRAAGLTEAFANRYRAAAIGNSAGFLTSETPIEMAGTICEPVIWTGSSDDRKLRRELRARNAFPHRVKTRGVEHNANELEKRYRGCGEQPITLWIGRSGQKRYAVMTQ